jgi:predicted nucleic acid-binding Zn ribbon protein
MYNEQPIGVILKELLETYRLQHKLHENSIREIWSTVMGKTIANYTTAITLRKGQLTVHINSAPLRQELSQGRDKIRRNLNEALGEEIIAEVIVK